MRSVSEIGGLSPNISYSNILFTTQMSRLMQCANGVYSGRLRTLITDICDPREDWSLISTTYQTLKSYLVNVSDNISSLVCQCAFLGRDWNEDTNQNFYIKIVSTNLAGGDSIETEISVMRSNLAAREEIDLNDFGGHQGLAQAFRLKYPLFVMPPIYHSPNFATSRTQIIKFQGKEGSSYTSLKFFAFWIYEMPL